MIFIDTSTLTTPASLERLGRTLKHCVYNGLDCCITNEILPLICDQMDEGVRATYAFEMELLGPILDMNMRGVRVDQEARSALVDTSQLELATLEEGWRRICYEGLGGYWKWSSTKDMRDLLYSVLGLPPIYTGIGEERHLSVDREALEKCGDYFHAQPIVGFTLAMRDLQKKLSFLRTGIDEDGRLRTSYNIGGTKVGRLSSTLSDFGTGTNLQNVEPRLRRIFIPDSGYVFCNIDLEQSDSRAVGIICYRQFGATKYLDACESGDIHTTVSRYVWPHLDWTGSLLEDRKIADKLYHRHFKYRDISKREGHGTNFMGTAQEMARQTKVPVPLIKAFQEIYLREFPEISDQWWPWVENVVRTEGKMTTLLGRRRHFFGRRNDRETIKSAVAFEPAAITADTLNRGLLRCWRANLAQILLQVHDSILFQVPIAEVDEIVPQLRALMLEEYNVKGRRFAIPNEASVGYNWDYASEDNPRGLRKYGAVSASFRQAAA